MPANIVVPEVGESIVDARIAKWLRQEGDVVAAGDPLVELETDKIDLEVSAPQAGVLARIARKDGDDVKVGEVLGVIEESGATAGNGGAAAAAKPIAKAAAELAAKAAPAITPAAPTAAGKPPRATPTARKAAEQQNVDLASVRGSGDAGRVMRRDVEQAAKGVDAKPSPVPAVPVLPVAEKPRTPS